jgi:hypothetical protein
MFILLLKLNNETGGKCASFLCSLRRGSGKWFILYKTYVADFQDTRYSSRV